jgi:hypothetical protein
MLTASIPASVRSAVWNLLKPGDVRTFFFDELVILLDYIVEVPSLSMAR